MQIDHYALQDELARGGQGVVYRAFDTRLRRPVVLKLLHASDPDLQRRLLREAKALAQLQHSHLVPLHGVGDYEGRPYLVLPFVGGESLQERLQRGGPLPVDEALGFVHEVGQALGAAHAAGLIHRDVKPANVLLDEQGRALLTDFGLVKRVGDRESLTLSLSVRGNFLGTPGYWPPEQAMGELERIGPAADVYGLGALLYALLSGKPPRDGATLQVALGAVFRDVEPLATFRGDVPRWVERLVAACLQFDPGQRPKLPRVLRALEERAFSRERSGRGARVAGLGALLLAAGLGGWWLVRGGAGEDEGGEAQGMAGPEEQVSEEQPTAEPLPVGSPRERLRETTRRLEGWRGVSPDAELEQLAAERYAAERELGRVLAEEVFARAANPGDLGDLEKRIDLDGVVPPHLIMLMVGIEIQNELQTAPASDRALLVRQAEYCLVQAAEAGEQEALPSLARLSHRREDLAPPERRALEVALLWRAAEEGSRFAVGELGWSFFLDARVSPTEVNRAALAQLSELLVHLKDRYGSAGHHDPRVQLALSDVVAFEAIWVPREDRERDLAHLGRARDQLLLVRAQVGDPRELSGYVEVAEELLEGLNRRLAEASGVEEPR